MDERGVTGILFQILILRQISGKMDAASYHVTAQKYRKFDKICQPCFHGFKTFVHISVLGEKNVY